MIVTVRKNSEKQNVERLIQQLTLKGLEVNYSEGEHHIVLGLVGDTTGVDITWIRSFDFVQEVTRHFCLLGQGGIIFLRIRKEKKISCGGTSEFLLRKVFLLSVSEEV